MVGMIEDRLRSFADRDQQVAHQPHVQHFLHCNLNHQFADFTSGRRRAVLQRPSRREVGRDGEEFELNRQLDSFF